MQSEVVELLSKPGGGREYSWVIQLSTSEAPDLMVNVPSVEGSLPAFERDVPHVASSPGDPPARDTGDLAQSIAWEMEGDLSAVVKATKDYAVHLEFGTQYMAARPFMAPAFRRTKGDMIKIVEEELERSLES
jgi:hypothetical protein